MSSNANDNDIYKGFTPEICSRLVFISITEAADYFNKMFGTKFNAQSARRYVLTNKQIPWIRIGEEGKGSLFRVGILTEDYQKYYALYKSHKADNKKTD